MSQNNIIERTLELPTEDPITKSEEFGLDGTQYKFSYTIERIGNEDPSQESSEESSEETSAESSPELLETSDTHPVDGIAAWPKKEPVYTKVATEIDKDNPNVRYYVYSREHVVNTKHGPETRVQTIRRRYEMHTPSPRELITDEIIKDLKRLAEGAQRISILSVWRFSYVPAFKERCPNFEPFSYAAFMKRWRTD